MIVAMRTGTSGCAALSRADPDESAMHRAVQFAAPDDHSRCTVGAAVTGERLRIDNGVLRTI